MKDVKSVTDKIKFESEAKHILYDCLSNLNVQQFKIFYSFIVHYWVEYKYFISKQNLFNLRCELNQLCHEIDESFPEQYDDLTVMKSFYRSHPYYFIEKLPIALTARVFAEHIDDRIDILINIAKTLYEADIYAAYAYSNKALELNEPIDTLIAEIQEHIEYFS